MPPIRPKRRVSVKSYKCYSSSDDSFNSDASDGSFYRPGSGKDHFAEMIKAHDAMTNDAASDDSTSDEINMNESFIEDSSTEDSISDHSMSHGDSDKEGTITGETTAEETIAEETIAEETIAKTIVGEGINHKANPFQRAPDRISAFVAYQDNNLANRYLWDLCKALEQLMVDDIVQITPTYKLTKDKLWGLAGYLHGGHTRFLDDEDIMFGISCMLDELPTQAHIVSPMFKIWPHSRNKNLPLIARIPEKPCNIIFPIRVDDHWLLGYFNKGTAEVSILDPIQCLILQLCSRHAILDFLRALKNARPGWNQLLEIKKTRLNSKPQVNDYDCGIFVLCNARSMLKNHEPCPNVGEPHLLAEVRVNLLEQMLRYARWYMRK